MIRSFVNWSYLPIFVPRHGLIVDSIRFSRTRDREAWCSAGRGTAMVTIQLTVVSFITIHTLLESWGHVLDSFVDKRFAARQMISLVHSEDWSVEKGACCEWCPELTRRARASEVCPSGRLNRAAQSPRQISVDSRVV